MGKTMALLIALTFGGISNLEPLLIQLHELINFPHDLTQFELHFLLLKTKSEFSNTQFNINRKFNKHILLCAKLSIKALNRKDISIVS